MLKLLFNPIRSFFKYLGRCFGMNIWAVSFSGSLVESWKPIRAMTLFGKPLVTILFIAAGPFESEEEANEWIKDRMQEKYPHLNEKSKVPA